MLPCSSASRRAEGKGESHGQQNLDKRRTILLFLHVSRLAILALRTYLLPVSIRDPRYAYADTCVIPMDPISTISTPHYLFHVHVHSCTFPRVSAHGMSPHMGRSLTAAVARVSLLGPTAVGRRGHATVRGAYVVLLFSRMAEPYQTLYTTCSPTHMLYTHGPVQGSIAHFTRVLSRREKCKMQAIVNLYSFTARR